jgi:hypothetical protein
MPKTTIFFNDLAANERARSPGEDNSIWFVREVDSEPGSIYRAGQGPMMAGAFSRMAEMDVVAREL